MRVFHQILIKNLVQICQSVRTCQDCD